MDSRLHRLMPTHGIMLAVAYRFLPWAETRLNAPILRNVALVVVLHAIHAGLARPVFRRLLLLLRL